MGGGIPLSADSLNHIEDGIANADITIDGGSYLPGSVTANTIYKTRIDFTKKFSSVPVVVVGYSGTSTSATYGSTVCGCQNTDTTGFDITFYNGTTGDKSPRLNWIAVGV